MRKIYLLVFFSFLCLVSCQKKESVLIYNETNNTIEVVNKNYSILAVYINTKDDKGVEKEEAGLEFKKKDIVYQVGLDTIFLTKKILENKNVPYEISTLLRHFDRKDTLIEDKDKLKLLILNSKEIEKGGTNFKEFFK